MGRSNHQSFSQSQLNDGSCQRQSPNVHSFTLNSSTPHSGSGTKADFNLEREMDPVMYATSGSRGNFYSAVARFSGHLALAAFFGIIFVGCGSILGSQKKDSSEASGVSSHSAKPVLQTTVSETSGSIFVKFVQADSSRLMERLMVAEKLISVNQSKLLSKALITKDGALNLACQAKANAKATENCVLKINKSEGQTVTSIVRDPLKIDQTITIGSSAEAKKLYESLNLKEWDLGASKMIRFASFDNRFILECSKSETASRCQIFLTDGTSDGDSSSGD